VRLSTFVWEWQEDIEARLKRWEQLRVQKTFVALWKPFEHLERVAQWLKL